MPDFLKRSRPFYGWYIVATGFVLGFFVNGLVFYGFTTIFKPIVAEFGWSYATVSLAASLRGVESGLLAPVVGMLIDRWGPRRIVFIGASVLALGLFMLSRVNSLTTFFVSFILISTAMGTCAVTVVMAAVSNWFRRKVGLAMSIVSAGFGAGGVMVFVMARLVDVYGWRMMIQSLSIGVLVIVLPLSLLLRHKPQQYGYLPDGDPPQEAGTLAEKAVNKGKEYGLTIKEAVKTRTFWLLAVMFVCHHFIVAAVVTHVMPYLTDVGLDTTMASIGAAGIPLVSIAGRMGFGALGDKMSRKRLMVVMFAIVSLGLVSFQISTSYAIAGMIVFLALFGTGYGGFNSVRPAFTRQVFGTKHYGTIFGCLIGMGFAGTMAGPVVAGRLFDIQGSYHNIWLLFALVAFIAFIASIAINNKQLYSEDESVD